MRASPNAGQRQGGDPAGGHRIPAQKHNPLRVAPGLPPLSQTIGADGYLGGSAAGDGPNQSGDSRAMAGVSDTPDGYRRLDSAPLLDKAVRRRARFFLVADSFIWLS